MSDVPPGRCGAPAPGHMQSYWCELLAGHTGMHQANDWSANTETHLAPPAIVAWTDPEGDGGPRREDPRIARIRGLIDEREQRAIDSVARTFYGDPFPALVATDDIRAILDGQA